MTEGMSFSFPSLLFHEGRTYGQPEVVPISLPQVATGLRSRLPGSFRRRGFQPDLLMPQEALFARGAHSMQDVYKRQGYGIGLSAAQAIVGAWGGTITATVEGKNTMVFTVAF